MQKFKFDVYDIEGRLSEDEYMEVHLVLNNICNQNCYYCLCKSHPNTIKTKTELTTKQFYKVIEFIKKQERKHIEFYFFGGEPTVHPRLREYINILENELPDMLGRIIILTNLTKDVNYFLNLSNNVYLVTSIHTSECKDWDQWFKNAIKIKNRISLLKIVLDHTNLNDVKYLYDKYSKYFKDDQIEVQMIYQLTDEMRIKAKEVLSNAFVTDGSDNTKITPDNTKIIINGIRQKSYKAFENYTNFQGHMCNAGFWILENGDVIKCSEDIREPPYYNIYKDHITKINMWSLCTHNNCNCEEFFPKISISHYLKYYNI